MGGLSDGLGVHGRVVIEPAEAELRVGLVRLGYLLTGSPELAEDLAKMRLPHGLRAPTTPMKSSICAQIFGVSSQIGPRRHARSAVLPSP